MHQTAPTSGMRFQIVHMIYTLTMLGVALATFGPEGGLIGLVVCGFWAFVFTSEARPEAFRIGAKWVFWVLAPLALWLLLFPAVSTPRTVARRMNCANHLKQIALALHNYHDVHQSFPPAYIADANGTPMHSWRVLILPYLEQQVLYDQYDFTEPWDGPNNRKLLNKMPPVYACPTSFSRTGPAASETAYLAVVGQATAWPGPLGARFADISDGTSNTALVIEHYRNIPWMAPNDMTLPEALAELTSDEAATSGLHQHQDFFYEHFRGRNMALADGAVHFIPHGYTRETWSGILRANDGVRWDERAEGAFYTLHRLRIDNCLRLSAFVLVTILPLPWVFRRSSHASDG